jgi:hypothetical protein
MESHYVKGLSQFCANERGYPRAIEICDIMQDWKKYQTSVHRSLVSLFFLPLSLVNFLTKELREARESEVISTGLWAVCISRYSRIFLIMCQLVATLRTKIFCYRAALSYA